MKKSNVAIFFFFFASPFFFLAKRREEEREEGGEDNGQWSQFFLYAARFANRTNVGSMIS